MFRYLYVFVLVLTTGCTTTAPAPENLHIAHCLQGCPTGTPATNEIIVRHLYAVSVNADTRLADWVSYRILPDSIGVASLLPREWQNDGLTRNGVRLQDLDGPADTLVQPNLGDQPDSVYRITEFSVNAGDRGRLVPMTSFAATSFWDDLNLLSVMSPMKSDLRLESWARLDQAINQLVAREGELYVISGPVYGSLNTLQPGGAINNLPVAFFKIVANGDGEAASFLFVQDLPVHANHCDQLTSLSSIEARTGLAFFPQAAGWPVGSLAGRLGC